MASEPKNIQEQGFRSSLFGFDKNDVLAYMNTLANEAQQQELEYQQKLQALQDRIDALGHANSGTDAQTASLQERLAAAEQRADAAEAKQRELTQTLEEVQRQADTYRDSQKESQKSANMWQLKCHDLQQQAETLQQQMAASRQMNAAIQTPTPDAVRSAQLEARKILQDAKLYADSAEKELQQQAEQRKTRMAENARGIAAGVMLVRERLARVDERLAAATLDLDGLTQTIYQALDETESELKELGTQMRDYAQGTPETDASNIAPQPAAAADKPETKQFRVKAQAQPVRQKPQPKPANRLRNNRRPVSQLLQDQIDRLDEQNNK